MSTENKKPMRASLLSERPADPCVIVIFGATGDLAQRKLFPAFMHLTHDGKLPKETVMVAVSRNDINENEFRKTVIESAKEFDPKAVPDDNFAKEFSTRIYTVVEEDTSSPTPFKQLPKRLAEFAKTCGTCNNALFYFSVPPSAYETLAKKLGASGLANPPEGGWARVIVEKPFGQDLESARKLNNTLTEVFRESQVYRIDHYLGKETVQNILVLRLANILFEPLWNHNYIDHVQITAAESLGVEDRAQYYDKIGALRDMVQNHLLQIMGMVAMELPASLNPEAVRDEKKKVFEAIRPFTPEDVKSSAIRAQYSEGAVSGKVVLGYLSEKGVNPKSQTETYTALRLFIDNWRWARVPFFIRTGKRLPKRSTEVAIQFKQIPHRVFASSPLDHMEPNLLVMRIQPDEGVTLRLSSKIPGYAIKVKPVDLEFHYDESFTGRIADAYERLLLDAMIGDPTLFARRDSVEEGWKFVEPILEAWEHDSSPLPQYVAGTWGPTEADAMIAESGRKWRKI